MKPTLVMNIDGVETTVELPNEHPTVGEFNAAVAGSVAAGRVWAVDPNDPVEKAAEEAREMARQDAARRARKEAARERRLRKRLEVVRYGRGGNLMLTLDDTELLLRAMDALGADD